MEVKLHVIELEVEKENEARWEKKTEAEHERVKWEGEALRGENEGVLRRRGESERSNL